MKILRIQAHDFGKLSGALDLAGGLTVVHGTNEAGKSTWLQAIFAGLCGRRRGRGANKKEEREFERQYEPWNGKPWRATLKLQLDDGRRIEIQQRDLKAKSSVAHDVDTGRPVGDELHYSGSIDGSRFLGLNRQVMPSTLVIGQGDIQRLRQGKGDEASALREELQRAAASASGAATAAQALSRLRKYASEQVGQERRNSTRPLQRAINHALQASQALTTGRERHEERQRLERRLQTARDRAKRAAGLTRHCERLLTQRELKRLDARLAKIDRLATLFPDGQPPPAPGESPDARVARQLPEAMFEYRGRPEEPVGLNGPNAEEMTRELAALPDSVEGDREEAPEVAAATSVWREAAAAVRAQPAAPETRTGETAEELERLLDQLPDTPEGDREVAPEVAAATSEWREAAAASRALPDEPETTTGETVEDLQRQLDQLADTPEGDREVAPEITAATSAWRNAVERQLFRQRMEPSEPAKPPIAATDREAVRQAMHALLRPAIGTGDETDGLLERLRVQNETLHRQIRRTRTKEGWAWCGAATGAPLAILPLLDAVSALIGVGATLLIIFSCTFIVRFRRSRTGLLDEKQTLGAQAAYAEAEARKHRRQEERIRAETDDAKRTLERLDLDAEPDVADQALRQLARWETWKSERSEWQQHMAAARTDETAAETALRAELAHRGVESLEQTTDTLLDRYERKCRQNARTDREVAAKRQELALRLQVRHRTERTAAEQRRRTQSVKAAEAEAEAQLRAVLDQRGVADPEEDAATLLNHYERECRHNAQTARELASERQQLISRLETRRRDERTAAEQRKRTRDAKTAEVEAEAQLRLALSQRGVVDPEEDAATLLDYYEQECRRNALRDRKLALKRQELASRIEARRRAETIAAEQQEQRKQAEARFRTALAAAGFPADSTADPVQWAAEWLEQREARLGRLRADWERLQRFLDGRTREDVAAERETTAARLNAFGTGLTDLKKLEELSEGALERKQAEARAETAEAEKQASNSEVLLAVETEFPSLAELEEEEAAAKSAVVLLRRAADVLETAREHLEAAQDEVHRMLAPDLRAALAERLELVTAGRYSNARIDPEEGLEVRLEVEDGVYRSASELSHGTVDQVYLLLRIALAEALGDRTESAPLFLDDATVHCDTDRTMRFLDLLLDLSAERQIVVFSQEEEVRAWAAQRLAARPRHSLIELDPNGLPVSNVAGAEATAESAPPADPDQQHSLL